MKKLGRWPILATALALSGCATPIPVVTECALPPPLPQIVLDQADRQQPSYSDRAKSLLELFETLIQTAPH